MVSRSIDPSIVSAAIEGEGRVAFELGQPEVRPERRDDGADEVGQDVLRVVELDVGEVAGVAGDVGDQEAGGLRGGGHRRHYRPTVGARIRASGDPAYSSRRGDVRSSPRRPSGAASTSRSWVRLCDVGILTPDCRRPVHDRPSSVGPGSSAA